MTINKYEFMEDLLKKKDLSMLNKERLFVLIAKELKEDQGDKTIMNDRLQELERKMEEMRNLNENSKMKNVINESKNSNYKKKTPPITHNPIETTILLKKFKYNNDSGFKELVHTPSQNELTEETYDQIIEQAGKSFKLLKNVPYGLYKCLENLISLLGNEGKRCFIETKKHPYLNNECRSLGNMELEKYKYLSELNNKTKFISYLIQSFKKNYRFDNEPTEASLLSDLIENTLKKRYYPIILEKQKKFSNENLEDGNVYINYEIHKDLKNDSIFFTWVPNVLYILTEIFNDTLKHGNINGKTDFDSNQKKISFSLNREEDEENMVTKIILEIFDQNSVCLKNPERLWKDMFDKRENFISICDWEIEADFLDNVSCRLNILTVNNKDKTEKINKVSGFRHKLIFYEK